MDRIPVDRTVQEETTCKRKAASGLGMLICLQLSEERMSEFIGRQPWRDSWVATETLNQATETELASTIDGKPAKDF